MKIHFLLLLFCLTVMISHAQDWSLERSVQTYASIQNNPATITLHWVSQPAVGFSLFRRLKGQNTWGIAIANLPGNADTYEDSNVAVGENYEYRLVKDSPINGYGFINAGIEVPMSEQRGRLILVVDNTHATTLASEITRLIADMEGDGWAVTKVDVSPADAVISVKTEIMNHYDADPDNTLAVLLLGHVPVPYSGQLYPDGHQDHEGAWPADLYYGEVNGFWTDASVNFAGATDPRNHNVPGDGKFDQSVIPSNIDLQVSRIDFANLPAFAESESELLKKYLDKNHAFRHKHFTATPKGLLENNFGGAAEGFGQNAYRNFTTMFGIDGTDVVDYNTLKTESYLWSYGAGGGNYTGASGIITTQEFVDDSIQSVFSMLFGSYFGDWDSENNLLRSALGSGTVLTNAWAGRPKFQFEHMALGENIGYGLPLTQNTPTNFIQDTCYGGRLTHIALMGDLTLRMHIVTPPGESLSFSENGGDVTVSWTASAEADLGYHVFRKEVNAAFFERLTETPVNELNYTIECVDPDIEYVYMVRALRLETSASGSYYNLSQGIKGNYTLQVACASGLSDIENISVTISPIPTDDLLHIQLAAPTTADFQLELRNINGQTVLLENTRAQQTHTLSTVHLPAGIYLLVIRNESRELLSRKVVVFK